MENKELVENCRIWYEEGFNDCKKEKDKKFKEFIRLLKKEIVLCNIDCKYIEKINKLSGLNEEENWLKWERKIKRRKK